MDSVVETAVERRGDGLDMQRHPGEGLEEGEEGTEGLVRVTGDHRVRYQVFRRTEEL